MKDVACDGVLDPSDPGIDGVLVELLAADGTTVLQSGLTASWQYPGLYQFENVPSGQYLVRVADIAGHVLTTVECLTYSGA